LDNPGRSLLPNKIDNELFFFARKCYLATYRQFDLFGFVENLRHVSESDIKYHRKIHGFHVTARFLSGKSAEKDKWFVPRREIGSFPSPEESTDILVGEKGVL
jgi:hypothetical protein